MSTRTLSNYLSSLTDYPKPTEKDRIIILKEDNTIALKNYVPIDIEYEVTINITAGGNPVPYANVIVFNIHHQTDDNGQLIVNATNGSYDITVYLDGYVTKQESFSVLDTGRNVNISLELPETATVTFAITSPDGTDIGEGQVKLTEQGKPINSYMLRYNISGDNGSITIGSVELATYVWEILPASTWMNRSGAIDIDSPSTFTITQHLSSFEQIITASVEEGFDVQRK